MVVEVPAEEHAGPGVLVVEEVPIIQTTQLVNPIILKIKIKAKNLTRKAQRPAQMFQLMRVLATGKKVAKLHTVVTPWSVAGLTSLSLENEKLASLTK